MGFGMAMFWAVVWLFGILVFVFGAKYLLLLIKADWMPAWASMIIFAILVWMLIAFVIYAGSQT